MKQWNGENEHKKVDQDKQFWVLQKVYMVILIIAALFFIAYVIQSLLS